MKKAIIAACIIGSLFIVLAQFDFFEALMMFWLAGVVPGTSYSVPSNMMYSLLLIGISIIIIRLIGLSVLDFFFEDIKKPAPKKSGHKKRLPKRRFSQI